MSEPDRLLAESIVLEAADRDITERSAFLDEACGGNSDLRREVESLLQFEPETDRFLQRPAMETAAQLAAADVAFDAVLQIDGYEIGELLGVGGMGEVYRARDIRLERDVAIKIIHHVPDDDIATARFEEKARAASRLNHPNIVTVHAVGSQGDLSYIVMELVTGQRLRDLIAAGPLPPPSTLDIAAQLADGLVVAHEMGVVHRDLKPENVMVTPVGLVKILDFGIARRHVSSGQPFAETSAAGTAAYMSPEQAVRGAIDHRSDQYSFGAIVYEMVCGRRSADCEPAPGASRPDLRIDPAFAAIIERCLKATPDGRYASTRDLAVAVRAVRDRTIHTPRSLTRRQAIAAVTVAGAAIAAALWRLPFRTASRRLAVLPFVNRSGDEPTEILCDGITEVLIRQLSRVENLTVIGRMTAFRLKSMPQDPREMGRQLGVDQVLNGSVFMRGGRAQVDVELADAKTGANLWSDILNLPDADVLAIQHEIAATIIAKGLGIGRSDTGLRELNGGLASNPEAYGLFLQAVHHFRLDTEDHYLTARQLLVESVAHDPTFALAHLTLASTYSVMAVDGLESPQTAWPRSRQNVDRALEHDPELPDARAERATEAFFFHRDWAGAQREWDLALQSRRAEVQGELLTSYVLQLWALGRFEDALRFARAARAVDPLSPALAVREADVLAAMGNFSSAVERYMAIIADAPDDSRARMGLAQVLRTQGKFDDALDAWRRVFATVDDEELTDVLANARGDAGCRGIDRWIARAELGQLAERAASGKYASPLDRARAHARLDEREEAFTLLAKAFDDQAAGLVFLNVDPAWDNIRRDPRFVAAVHRAGLPPAGHRG